MEGTEQAKLFVMALLFQPFLGRFALQRKESLKSFDGCLQLCENILFYFKFDNFWFMGAKWAFRKLSVAIIKSNPQAML